MKKYFLGLDIGTNSCGWAVTDEEFNILRAKGKHGHKMWGVRLFEEASTAAERRVKRTNRRRLDRRKLKIMWLNEIFAPQLSKVDPKFLERLKYSALFEDDKEKFGLKSANSLFNDENFNDPTINPSIENSEIISLPEPSLENSVEPTLVPSEPTVEPTPVPSEP